PELLAPLAEYPFFYPSSGTDFLDALTLFAPTIRTFWFADNRVYQNIRNLPSLPLSSDYQLIDKKIDEAYSICRRSGQFTPLVCTERYGHLPTGQEIVIHRRH